MTRHTSQPTIFPLDPPTPARPQQASGATPAPFDARATLGMDLPVHQNLVIVPEGTLLETICFWCARRTINQKHSCEAQDAPERPRRRSWIEPAVRCVPDPGAVAHAPFAPPVPDLATLRVGDDVVLMTQLAYEVRVIARVLWIGTMSMVAATDRLGYRCWPTRTLHDVPIFGAAKNFNISEIGNVIACQRAAGAPA